MEPVHLRWPARGRQRGPRADAPHRPPRPLDRPRARRARPRSWACSRNRTGRPRSRRPAGTPSWALPCVAGARHSWAWSATSPRTPTWTIGLSMTNEEAARGPAARRPASTELLIDTGFRPAELVDVDTLGRLAGARTWTIVRLEWLAEDLIRSRRRRGWLCRARSGTRSRPRSTTAIGCKSVIAYRHRPGLRPGTANGRGGRRRPPALGCEPSRPPGTVRLTDPVLLRFGLWEGVRTGRPLQIHVGFGDTDLDLHRADPSL